MITEEFPPRLQIFLKILKWPNNYNDSYFCQIVYLLENKFFPIRIFINFSCVGYLRIKTYVRQFSKFPTVFSFKDLYPYVYSEFKGLFFSQTKTSKPIGLLNVLWGGTN